MNSTKQDSIGIFDSGIGGTSIWKEIHLLMPNENTIYLADSKHAPYGQKHKEDIIELSIKNTELLLEKNCKIIVVACNTATTNAIKILREKYSVPFIGIEPAIKPASIITKTNTIGILATKGTLNSELFAKTSNTLNTEIKIIEQIGEGLVPLIENGMIDSLEMESLLKKHLKIFIDNNVDSLVLGCTHYPYLIPKIKKNIGSEITIIDSGEAVANQTKRILALNNILAEKQQLALHQFFINTDTEVLTQILNTKYNNIEVNKLDF